MKHQPRDPPVKPSSECVDRASCIYCGAAIIPMIGKKDHVVPEAFGEFRGGLRFRFICDRCNSRIGEAEGQLAACGHESVEREQFLGAQRRRKPERIPAKGSASGAPFPRRTAQTSDGERRAIVDRRTGRPIFPDQLTIKDGSGTRHFVDLFPGMPPSAIREAIEGLGIDGPLSMEGLWDEDLSPGYLEALAAALPGADFGHFSTCPAGEQDPCPVRFDFTVTEAYFRAVAKAAFHNLLCCFIDMDGRSAEFDRIRNFIREGSQEGSDPPILDRGESLVRVVPGVLDEFCGGVRLCHLLAAFEFPSCCIGLVRFFVGPSSPTLTYWVRLSGHQNPRNPRWRFVVARYSFDDPVPVDGPVGRTEIAHDSAIWMAPPPGSSVPIGTCL